MISFDRRSIRFFDWKTFCLTLLIATIGLLFIFSATYQPEQPFSLFFKKQLFGVASGTCIYLLVSYMNYHTLMRWGYFAYFAVIGLLIFTIIKGSIGMGAQRWLNFGFFKLQPSELAKLFFPAFITYYLKAERDTFTYSFSDFVPILVVMGGTFILVLKQPDLGTALLILFSGITLLWFAGLEKKYFLLAGALILLSAPLSWRILKPYQKRRVLVFMGYGDNKKEGYQIEQSKIAIGSGGLIGKGFLNGTQNRLQFLPESRTDFIFSVIAEEMGLLGALAILLLYLFIFFHMIQIIKTLESPFMQLFSIGLIVHIMFSVIINIGMVIGLLPIVGIPLPLLSYGLSNLWITFASLGWCNSIAMRRFHLLP